MCVCVKGEKSRCSNLKMVKVGHAPWFDPASYEYYSNADLDGSMIKFTTKVNFSKFRDETWTCLKERGWDRRLVWTVCRKKNQRERALPQGSSYFLYPTLGVGGL